MTEQPHEDRTGRDDERDQSYVSSVGLGVVFGAGAGTVVFALTDNPIWIALGGGFGVALGAVIAAIRSDR